MKAYEVGPQTGLDSLHAVTRETPKPGFGEVLLKTRLVSLNNRDIQVLEGRYGAKKAENRIPVSEGVGEVVELGAGVSGGVNGLSLGDRAVFAHFVNWIDGAFSLSHFGTDYGITHDGWLAEYICVPAAALVKVPESLSDEQGAPLASSALTAWHAVGEVGQIKASDTVLALGTGGVAIWALQIAKAHGARVIITSSSDEKLELARKLGADITINYRTNPDWEAEVMKATDGAGADIIVETGGYDTHAKSVLAAAANARISFISVAPREGAPAINIGLVIYKNLVLKGIAEGSRAMLARLVRTIEQQNIQPVIDSTFAFDEAPAAYARLKSGGHVGKILIRVSE